MNLGGGLHLAYCTNVHRGSSWTETFAALETHTDAVRRRVSPDQPYAIGLRLGADAAAELARPDVLDAFRRWLDERNSYVFTINGFPYGSFHGTRVKEQVYAPDWSTPERLAYTNGLFDLLARLLPAGVAGSVSTVPVSFKGFPQTAERRKACFDHLSACARNLEQLCEKTGRDLHLGLEPEPLCLLETTAETVAFFADWAAHDPQAAGPWLRYVGVNYDCCHLAVEFETPAAALDRLSAAGIRLSKLHLSSALRVRPTPAARDALRAFIEPVYLHQVVAARAETGEVLRRYVDLPDALDGARDVRDDEEWRIHFHVPLHASPGAPFGDTRDHITGALDWLRTHPAACQHLEMETYTWEVLPPALRLGIEDQLVREYAWSLAELAARGLASPDLAARVAAAAHA
jgi:sugar phosphate isomerase/epimerase